MEKPKLPKCWGYIVWDTPELCDVVVMWVLITTSLCNSLRPSLQVRWAQGPSPGHPGNRDQRSSIYLLPSERHPS